MKITDFNRLLKFMEMTTSDSDNEALTAARMANKLLKEHKLTWKHVFNRLVTIDAEAADSEVEQGYDAGVAASAEVQRRKREREEHINGMLAKVLEGAAGGFRDFVLSLQAQFQTRGYLTDGQYEALRRSYNRAARS